MKKLIHLLLAAAILLFLCACGGSDTPPEPTEEIPATQESDLSGDWSDTDSGNKLATTPEPTEEIPVIQKSDLLGDWIDTDSGNKLIITNEQIEYMIVGVSSGVTGETFLNWNVSDGILEIDGFSLGELAVNSDGEYVRLIGEGCNFIPAAQYSATIQQVKLGETIKTDGAELTVNDITFSDTVSELNLDPTGDGYWTGDHQMTFACFEFTLTNNSKSAKKLNELCEFYIDYNDGYLFGENMTGSYAEKNWTFGYMHYDNGLGSGTTLELESLSSTEYRGCIECPIKVGEDTTSPLKIVVTLYSESGFETFEVVIR